MKAKITNLSICSAQSSCAALLTLAAFAFTGFGQAQERLDSAAAGQFQEKWFGRIG